MFTSQDLRALFVEEADGKPEDLNVDKLYQIVKEQGTVAVAYFHYQLPQLPDL
jgi:hypothetical protein